ncbi:hypothetical protein CR513_32223, partial [Mucuna pruriens]
MLTQFFQENKGKNGKSKEKHHDGDNDRVTTATYDDLVILRDFESVNLVSDESMWIIDSSATLHVTSRKEFFTSYTLGDFRVLKIGNDGVTKDMLSGLKNVELEKCSHCMARKQTRASFKKHHLLRKSELLELMHSDVCDPLKLWVHALKTNDQVLEKFKQFQALVERQLDKKVECIRYDNGGEYYGPSDCIFIGYGHDEYGYRLYDPVKKKLVRSRDVQFMEDQTIEDIDKVKKTTPKKDDSLSEIDLVQMSVHDLDIVDNNVKNDEQHNYLGDGFDISLDDDVEEEQEMSHDENPGDAFKSPPVQFKRSNKERQSSTSKNSTFHSKSKHIDVRYHWIHDALDSKLLELTKVHIDDNDADIMTKVLPRGKFESV